MPRFVREKDANRRAKEVGGRVAFIELDHFRIAWRKLGLDDDDFFALQDAILIDPTLNPVIPHTGGLRKMRFGSRSSQRGKRSSFRICFAYFQRFETIIMVLVYPKKAKENLSITEKQGIKTLLRKLETELELKSPKARTGDI